MTKTLLTGPKYGVKKIKEYNNPDIIKSKIRNSIYDQNKITLSSKKGQIYMYHYYVCTNTQCWGRWYDIDIKQSKYTLNQDKRTFEYIISKWENEWEKGKIEKDVSIKIYFTEKGWKKLMKVLVYQVIV